MVPVEDLLTVRPFYGALYGHLTRTDGLGDVAIVGAGTRRQGVLTIGLRADSVSCSTVWQPSANTLEPSTDDHPFPYLRGRSIPNYYLIALGVILLASIALVRAAGGPIRGMGGYADLFCMGAAFLLLETKNVVQFALLFGTTWFVNSLVFAAILLSVYAAVELARRVRLPSAAVLYAALAASLVVAFLVPPDRLLALDPVARFAVAGVISFLPVMLANLIFAQRFRDVGTSTVAFAANLLGAMVGGILEYGAIMIGYRDLLIVVAVLYALAFVLGRRHLGRAAGKATTAAPEAVRAG
jgi:hypothetical protein